MSASIQTLTQDRASGAWLLRTLDPETGARFARVDHETAAYLIEVEHATTLALTATSRFRSQCEHVNPTDAERVNQKSFGARMKRLGLGGMNNPRFREVALAPPTPEVKAKRIAALRREMKNPETTDGWARAAAAPMTEACKEASRLATLERFRQTYAPFADRIIELRREGKAWMAIARVLTDERGPPPRSPDSPKRNAAPRKWAAETVKKVYLRAVPDTDPARRLVAVQHAAADDRARQFGPQIAALRVKGASWETIAATLTERHGPPPANPSQKAPARWHGQSVRRAVERWANLTA